MKCKWCGVERDIRHFQMVRIKVGNIEIGRVCDIGNADDKGEPINVTCEEQARGWLLRAVERMNKK